MVNSAQVQASDPQAVHMEQKLAVESIRVFLKSKTSYDVLPVSYRLIVLDTSLLVKKSLNILLQNNVVSAPLWDCLLYTSRCV